MELGVTVRKERYDTYPATTGREMVYKQKDNLQYYR